jgi:antitoxin HigA-1
MSLDHPITRPLRRAPTHPGAVLRDEIIPALKMTVSDIASELHITRRTMHRIMTGATAITPELAVRLGKFCGNGPDLWLRMQTSYDLWHAQQALKDEIKTIPTHSAALSLTARRWARSSVSSRSRSLT